MAFWKLAEIDVNLPVFLTMFIGARDVIDHVIPYPVCVKYYTTLYQHNMHYLIFDESCIHVCAKSLKKL